MLALVSLLLAVAAPVPELHTLSVPGTLAGVRARDVDGDGRAEVLAIVYDADTESDRRLVWFVPGEDGAYPAEPSGALPLPAETGGVFLAEYDGPAPVEVMLTGADGVAVYRFAGPGALERTAEQAFQSLYPAHLPRPQFLDDAAADLDGDGVDDWFVPKPGGIEVRLAGRTPHLLACDVRGAMSPYGETRGQLVYRFPGVVPFREGGAMALALAGGRFVEIARGPDWAVGARLPIPWRMETPEREQRALRKGDDLMPRPPDATGDLILADLNADGLPDLVVTEAKGTVNAEATTRVYFAQPGPRYPETPDAVIENAGSYVKPGVVDLDGDGFQDLHFIEIPFGMGFLVNYFVRDRITMHLKGYLYRDGGYPEDPQLTARLALGDAQKSDDGAFTHGDFNGDGRADLALGDGTDTLQFRAGSEKDLFEDDPFATVDVPPYGVARTVRLDANERDDVVLFRPYDPEAARIHLIRF